MANPVPWTHQTTKMTRRKAYTMGWNASKNTKTYDLDAAEYRFEKKYGKAFSKAFNEGWVDYSAGYEKWHSFSDSGWNGI